MSQSRPDPTGLPLLSAFHPQEFEFGPLRDITSHEREKKVMEKLKKLEKNVSALRETQVVGEMTHQGYAALFADTREIYNKYFDSKKVDGNFAPTIGKYFSEGGGGETARSEFFLSFFLRFIAFSSAVSYHSCRTITNTTRKS